MPPSKKSIRPATHGTFAWVLVAAACTSALLLQDTARLPATIESVCISVTVLGINGGTPLPDSACGNGTGSTIIDSGGEEESSPGETVTDPLGDSGAPRRGSIPRAAWRMRRMIREWERRRSGHSAAPEESPGVHYADVPAGSWFHDAVAAFLKAGYLDASQIFFRPHDGATRAEMTKLVVVIAGEPVAAPDLPVFADVLPGSWYHAFIHYAAERDWVDGYGKCYRSSKLDGQPCFFKPERIVSRAEAAAIIVRRFALERRGTAPRFADNPTFAWYARDVQVAADHCILHGDGETGLVRPDDRLTRAEMVVMLQRALAKLSYGEDCRTLEPPVLPSGRGVFPGSAIKTSSLLPGEGLLCPAQTWLRCAAVALLLDTADMLRPLASLLTFPDFQTLRSVHRSESTLWLLGLLWIAVLGRSIYGLARHRHR